MAGGSTIGALRFQLGADTAEFERGVKGAQDALSRFGAFAGRFIGLAIVAAGALAAKQAFDALSKSIEDVSALNKLSLRSGDTVNSLNSLRAVAEQSGVEWKNLSGVIEGFGNKLRDGLASPTSEVSQIMSNLGINARDATGNVLSFSELLPRLADAFSRYRDDANKTAVAVKLFGEQVGPEMAQLLNQGGAALRQQMAAHQSYAAQLDPTRVTNYQNAQARLTDAIRQLQLQFTMLASGPATTVIQALADIARWLNEAAGNGDAVTLATRAYTQQLAVVEQLERGIAAGRAGRHPQHIRELNETLEKARERLAQLQMQLELQRAIQAAQAPAAPQNDPRPPMPGFQSQTEALRGMRDAAREAKDEARFLLDTIVNAPTETFVAKMAAVENALKNGTITMRQYGEMTRRIAKENQDQWLNLGSSVASAITTIFGQNKTAAIAAAIINTAVGITRALATLPPPFSWAQAALIAASGAAQIATIKSTNKNGSGNAPSVSGSGGGSGSDQPQAGPMQTLMVQGINPNQLYSGEAMRNLAEQLLDFQKDGGQVVLK